MSDSDVESGMKASIIALRRPRNARIEIIPLIDVIFFLLATFVLFTLSLNRIQAIPLVLPQSGPPDPAEVVSIQVSGDGALYWNTQQIRTDELPIRIAGLISQSADPKVILVSDEKARLGDTITVLDQLRLAGIKKYSVQTKPRATGM